MMEFIIDKKCIQGTINTMTFDTDDLVIDRVNGTIVNNLVLYGISKDTKLEFSNDIKEDEKKDVIKDVLDDEIEKTIEFRIGRLAQVAFRLLYQNDEDTDEGDCFIVLDEIEKLKSVIEIKYKKHLKIEKYKEYLDNLYYLDREIRRKITMINYENSMNEELSSRGR